MNLSEITNEKIVLLLGAPRSGTSWIGKIFDSHPDVVYRHEPDLVVGNGDLPWLCSREDADAYRAAAHEYVQRLLQTATLKTNGPLPVFRKHFHGSASWMARLSIVWLLRAAEQAGATRNLARTMPIPDLVGSSTKPLRIVIKSVSSLGRARLIANAVPGARIVLIVRDPRAQVASMLRGISLSMFERQIPVYSVLETPQAKKYGLTMEKLKALSPAEQLAWNWAILNEKALEDLDDIPNTRLLRYEKFIRNPLEQTKEFFDFAGLPWDQQTENFIHSSSISTRDRYYNVYQTADKAMNRWRSELTEDQQQRILAIVASTSLASLSY